MSQHLVITVHGIRTYGQWQERLESMVPEEKRDSIAFVHYKIGFFSLPRFLFPPARWLVTRRFRNDLVGHLSNKQWHRIDLVGHSFGTHVIAWALRYLSHPHSNKIHTLILAGSVLRNNFPWSQVLGRAAKRVVNECSVNDYVLILSQLFSLFTGSAGREGFVGATGRVPGSELRNRFFRVGHSGYFAKPNNTDASEFMKDHWIPLLLEDKEVDLIDFRVSDPISLFLTWLSNNADPIKLAVYLIPTILFVTWIYGLYKQEAAAKFSALENESRTLALVSKRMTEIGNFQEAIRLGLTGLPKNIADPNRPYVPEAESALYSAVLSYRHNLLRSFPTNHVVLEAFTNSATSRIIALASRDDQIVPTNGGLLRLYDLETNELLFQSDVSEFPTKFANSANGNQFAFVDRSGAHESVVIHDVLHGITSRHSLNEQYWRIDDIAFTSDATHVLAVVLPLDSKEEIVLHSWSVDSKAQRSSPEITPVRGAYRSWTADFRFDYDAQYVWSSDAGKARLWRVSTGKLLATITPGKDDYDTKCSSNSNWSKLKLNVDLLAFDKSGRFVIFESVRGVAVVWDIKNDSQVAMLSGHTDRVRDAVFSNDGRRVFTASADRTVRIWDVLSADGTTESHLSSGDSVCASQASLIGVLVGHDDEVTRVAVTREDTVLTTSLDGSLREWEIGDRLQVNRLNGFSGGATVEQLYFGPGGREVLVLSREFTGLQGQIARLWKLDAGENIPSFLASGPRRNRVVLDPNGRRALTMSQRHPETPQVWDVDTAKELSWLSGHQEEVLAAAFSGDGRFVVTGSADGYSKVWEVESGTKLFDLRGHEEEVIFVTFSSNDRFIVTASKDQTIRIWDARKGVVVEEIPYLYQTMQNYDYTQRVMDMLSLIPIKLSSDGKYLVFPMFDLNSRSIVVWNVKEKKQHRLFRVANTINQVWQPHFDMCLSKNKLLIVSPDDLTSVRVFDLDDQMSDISIGGHSKVVLHGSFNRNCDQVITGSLDRTARIWDLRRGQLISNLVGHGATVIATAFSEDGQKVVTASGDKSVRIWEVASGKQSNKIDLVHTGSQRVWVALDAWFTRNGERVVTVSADAKGLTNRIVRIYPFYRSQSLIDHARRVLVNMEAGNGQ